MVSLDRAGWHVRVQVLCNRGHLNAALTRIIKVTELLFQWS